MHDDKVRKRVAEATAFDDMMLTVETPVVVGSRVKYRETGEQGVIIAISLRESPFRVKWDDDSHIDTVDWYRGDQLGPVNAL